MLIRAALLALLIGLLAPGSANAVGIIDISGSTIRYSNPAPSTDTDNIAVFPVGTFIRFTNYGDGLGASGTCGFVAGDTNSVDCPRAGITTILLDLGPGNDTASVSPAINITTVFNGGDGNDAFFGGGGFDIFNGDAGDDNIVSRDG